MNRSDLLAALPADIRDHLLPVGPNKAPTVGMWQQPDRRFTDQQLLKAAAIGLRLGHCGITAVDLDSPPGDPEAAERAFLALTGRPISDLPISWSWTSGKPGRRQIGLLIPAGQRDGLKPVKAGPLELRWIGQQSVISGAHPETGGYTWLASPAEAELAIAPDWLIAVMRQQMVLTMSHQVTSPGDLPPRDREQLFTAMQQVPPFHHGEGRRDELLGLALRLWMEIGRSDAIELLRAHSPGINDLLGYFVTKPTQISAGSIWPFLREHYGIDIRRHDLQDAARDPLEGFHAYDDASGPQEPRQRPRQRLSDRDKISALRRHAAALLADGTPFAERLPLLRGLSESFDISLRDDELRRLIWDARRAAAGAIEPLRPGDQIAMAPAPWHWSGVVMAECLNLLVALPKIGKTSLLLAMLGAWHHGAGGFLELNLCGPCPPVLIVGTDQPAADWGRMLQEVDLIGADHTIRAPIVALFHKGRPLHLDPEGIETIASYAATNPGLLIVLDSIAACTGPLGLDENSAEIVEPINDLMEAISPHRATLVAVHHSSKGRAGESATLASRGSTALPAAASQIVSLSRVASSPTGPQERRIVLKTEGRAGSPCHLLIERTAEGWVSYGDADAVERAQALLASEEKLTDRQGEVLELVRDRFTHGSRSDAASLAELMGGGSNGERNARRTLDALARRGLLHKLVESTAQGRKGWFWPVAAQGDRTPSRGGLDFASYPSSPSDPVKGSESSGPVRSKGKDGKDGLSTEDRPPREGVLTPPAQVELPEVPSATVGSAWDAGGADGDDPHWRPRPRPAHAPGCNLIVRLSLAGGGATGG